MPHDHTTAVPSPRVEAKAPPDPGCWTIRYCQRGKWHHDMMFDRRESAEGRARSLLADGVISHYRLIHIPPETTP